MVGSSYPNPSRRALEEEPSFRNPRANPLPLVVSKAGSLPPSLNKGESRCGGRNQSFPGGAGA